jgi:hypothetical protein
VANEEMATVNIEQLEAELAGITGKRLATIEVAPRAAFVLTMLVQNALVRGELRGVDAFAFSGICLEFGPMWEGCPNVQTRISKGWPAKTGN